MIIRRKISNFKPCSACTLVHTLFDLEAQVPTIFHITKAKLHDVNGKDAIPYEPGSFYVFDRAYNDFRRLHHIKEVGSFFVVRAKNPLKYQYVRWKIELFFKWMKQHLNIQRFWAETENAVLASKYTPPLPLTAWLQSYNTRPKPS